MTEAGSGVVSEQRNRLIATIKFICAEIQKRKGYKKKGWLQTEKNKLQ